MQIKKFINPFVIPYIFLSLFFALICFLRLDPFKSGYYLVLRVLSYVPLFAYCSYVYFSYYVCLLFLSGVFVLIVYICSLSSSSSSKSNFGLLVFFLSLVYCYFSFSNYHLGCIMMSMNEFYYDVYLVYFVYIVLFLLLFLNFVSYFINFKSALRKF